MVKVKHYVINVWYVLLIIIITIVADLFYFPILLCEIKLITLILHISLGIWMYWAENECYRRWFSLTVC